MDCIILAGGNGERLGGVSKSDIELGGRRLIERVLEALEGAGVEKKIVVAPGGVVVPDGAIQTMEEPAGGGPLAGIAAGLRFVQSEWVGVFAVDTPGIEGVLAELLGGIDKLGEAEDGVATVTGVGSEGPYRQYLQAVYRSASLRSALDAAGSVHNRGVRRVLGELALRDVQVDGLIGRDLDTAEDLEWWTAHYRDGSASLS